jgi:NAD(P)H-hydrate epimerase
MPELVLMENAGIKLYRALSAELEEPSRILFLAGKGNNGGDALVMGRQCYLEGLHVPSVLLVGPRRSDATTAQTAMCRSLGIPMVEWSSDEPEISEAAQSLFEEADLIVDGLFGTGLDSAMREPYTQIVDEINRSSASVFSIDIPSGLGPAFREDFAAVKADLTLTVELPKAELYTPAARPFCGRIRVVPIGFPPDLLEDPALRNELYRSEELSALLPSIPPTAYKHSRGVVAVLAGSVGASGAAMLAGEAAAAAGSGLVTCLVDEEIYPIVAGASSSVMVEPLGPELDLGRYSAAVVGPGWGRSAERAALLERILASDLVGVLDADAINLLSDRNELSRLDLGNKWVLTPHPGEFKRLAEAMKVEPNRDDPREALVELSERLAAAIVYKSHVMWIASPGGELAIVDGMNPAMGTGGTGDVLAGAIASFLGSGVGAGAAARTGCLLVQTAGRRARGDLGMFAAEQLLPYLAAFAGERLLGEED